MSRLFACLGDLDAARRKALLALQHLGAPLPQAQLPRQPSSLIRKASWLALTCLNPLCTSPREVFILFGQTLHASCLMPHSDSVWSTRQPLANSVFIKNESFCYRSKAAVAKLEDTIMQYDWEMKFDLGNDFTHRVHLGSWQFQIRLAMKLKHGICRHLWHLGCTAGGSKAQRMQYLPAQCPT